MNKFTIGQQVICIDSEASDLDHLRCYTVSGYLNAVDPPEIYLDGEKFCWMECRFEDANEWAKHQVPVKTKTYYVIKIVGFPEGPKLYYMAMLDSHLCEDKAVAINLCRHANNNFGNDGLLTGVDLKYEVIEINI